MCAASRCNGKRLSPSNGSHQPFPTYPWQRQRFWAGVPGRACAAVERPLAPCSERASAARIRRGCRISDPTRTPFSAITALDDRAVFPAAGYVELMLAAVALGLEGIRNRALRRAF